MGNKYMAGNVEEHKDANPKEDESSVVHNSEQCFVSAWNSSALTFKLPYSTAEPMFSLHTKTAVTISTWMYWDFHSPSNSNEWNRFHIFSVGSKSLLLECWIDNATIQVRVTSIQPKTDTPHAQEQRIAGKATFHLTDFSSSDKNSKKKRKNSSARI